MWMAFSMAPVICGDSATLPPEAMRYKEPGRICPVPAINPEHLGRVFGRNETETRQPASALRDKMDARLLKKAKSPSCSVIGEASMRRVRSRRPAARGEGSCRAAKAPYSSARCHHPAAGAGISLLAESRARNVVVATANGTPTWREGENFTIHRVCPNRDRHVSGRDGAKETHCHAQD